VVTAQQRAREAGNDLIGIGHLLLGLVADPESAAARTVIAQGVSLADVERLALATLPPAADRVPALIPFDEVVTEVLQRTFAKTQDLAVDTIGSEHVLLAVLAVDHGTGVLAGLGVTPEATEAQLRAIS